MYLGGFSPTAQGGRTLGVSLSLLFSHPVIDLFNKHSFCFLIHIMDTNAEEAGMLLLRQVVQNACPVQNTASSVRLPTAACDVHILVPETENATCKGKRKFADGTMWRVLQWRDHPGSLSLPTCKHQCPYGGTEGDLMSGGMMAVWPGADSKWSHEARSWGCLSLWRQKAQVLGSL